MGKKAVGTGLVRLDLVTCDPVIRWSPGGVVDDDSDISSLRFPRVARRNDHFKFHLYTHPPCEFVCM